MFVLEVITYHYSYMNSIFLSRSILYIVSYPMWITSVFIIKTIIIIIFSVLFVYYKTFNRVYKPILQCSEEYFLNLIIIKGTRITYKHYNTKWVTSFAVFTYTYIIWCAYVPWPSKFKTSKVPIGYFRSSTMKGYGVLCSVWSDGKYEHTASVHQIIEANPPISTRRVVDQLGTSQLSVVRILHELTQARAWRQVDVFKKLLENPRYRFISSG